MARETTLRRVSFPRSFFFSNHPSTSLLDYLLRLSLFSSSLPTLSLHSLSALHPIASSSPPPPFPPFPSSPRDFRPLSLPRHYLSLGGDLSFEGVSLELQVVGTYDGVGSSATRRHELRERRGDQWSVPSRRLSPSLPLFLHPLSFYLYLSPCIHLSSSFILSSPLILSPLPSPSLPSFPSPLSSPDELPTFSSSTRHPSRCALLQSSLSLRWGGKHGEVGSLLSSSLTPHLFLAFALSFSSLSAPRDSFSDRLLAIAKPHPSSSILTVCSRWGKQGRRSDRCPSSESSSSLSLVRLFLFLSVLPSLLLLLSQNTPSPTFLAQRLNQIPILSFPKGSFAFGLDLVFDGRVARVRRRGSLSLCYDCLTREELRDFRPLAFASYLSQYRSVLSSGEEGSQAQVGSPSTCGSANRVASLTFSVSFFVRSIPLTLSPRFSTLLHLFLPGLGLLLGGDCTVLVGKCCIGAVESLAAPERVSFSFLFVQCSFASWKEFRPSLPSYRIMPHCLDVLGGTRGWARLMFFQVKNNASCSFLSPLAFRLSKLAHCFSRFPTFGSFASTCSASYLACDLVGRDETKVGFYFGRDDSSTLRLLASLSVLFSLLLARQAYSDQHLSTILS